MSLSDVLPYFNVIGQWAPLVGYGYLFMRAQWAQHHENVARLDRITERLEAVEETGRRQTEILVNFARIEERVEGLSGTMKSIEGRMAQIEAGRRVASLKG